MPTESELTAVQNAPLVIRGASVALSAGAGCGKTKVLTERFLADLDGPDRRALGQIVALTFTEKAARELRDRVRRACRERLDAGDDPAHWRAILRGLEAAPIGTFHAFCARLLRRFAVEAGVEPGFAILEESIAPALREQALAACFRRWLARHDDDLRDLAVEFGLGPVRQALSDLVASRSRTDLKDWVAIGVEGIVGAWMRLWEEKARPSIVRTLVESARPCLDLLARHECTHPVMKERVAFLREQVPRLVDAIEPSGFLSSIREKAQVRGGGTKSHWPSEEVYKAVQKQLTRLRDAIDKALDQLAVDEPASRAAAALGLRFARLAAEAVEAYESAKRDAGMLDFDDLQTKTRGLLRDGLESISRGVAGTVDFLLVDEFQDTDPIQGEILELLAGAGLDQGKLFLVGDVKQSIYRFRGAQPRVFETFRARFPESGRLALTENFRSVAGLIDFVNALFAETFPGPEHALQPSPKTPAPSKEPAVEFLWAEEHSPGAKGQGVDERRKIEARWLARHVASRLKHGWVIRDPKTHETRRANAGDVVFLFRTLNDAAAYESALVKEELDYYVVGGSAFFAQQEVLDVINVLSVIEDPLDALALAGALRSPFFSVSDDALYWLATAPPGDLVRGFDDHGRIAELSPEDRRLIGRAHRVLEGWRDAKDRVPIAELVGRVLDESGYEAALVAEFLGPRKRANCRKLVRLARRYDAHGGFTVADFVARLRADLRKPPREEQAATTDEHGEAVRLMTIHQAKGLEFPVVVVPDIDRSSPHARDRVALHPELGPIVKPPDDRERDEEDSGTGRSLGWTIYRHLESREEHDEALRLLYVATTRARDTLVLSAGLGADEEPKSPALRLLSERFDRAAGECLAELPEGSVRPRVRIIAEPPPSLSSGLPRKRPKLRALARRIERAVPTEAPAPSSRIAQPRFVDLDPAINLSPIAARVDRLIRAVLAEPDALSAKAVSAIVARTARMQVPMASPTVEAMAEARLAEWVVTPLAREIAVSKEVRRAIPWTVVWPPGAGNGTVVQGPLDFAYRDAKGDWYIVAVSVSEAPEPAERLRLRLSALATIGVGAGPFVRGWRVRLGPGGGLDAEEGFDDEAIDRAFREWAVSLREGPS